MTPGTALKSRFFNGVFFFFKKEVALTATYLKSILTISIKFGFLK
jgi:hypothetical protein